MVREAPSRPSLVSVEGPVRSALTLGLFLAILVTLASASSAVSTVSVGGTTADSSANRVYRFTAPPVVLTANGRFRVVASVRPSVRVSKNGTATGAALTLDGFGEPAPTVAVPGFMGCFTREPEAEDTSSKRRGVVRFRVMRGKIGQVSATVRVRRVSLRTLAASGTPRDFARRAGCAARR